MPSDGSNWAQALGTPQAARSYSTQQKKPTTQQQAGRGLGVAHFTWQPQPRARPCGKTTEARTTSTTQV